MHKFLKQKLLLPVQLLAIILTIPLLMGQQDCQGIADHLMKNIQDLIQQKVATPPPGQQYVYVSQLSFIDALTKTTIGATEESELINDAVKAGIEKAVTSNSQLKYNEQGHEIANTDGNINKLIELIFDPNKTPKQRVSDIINQMLNPNNVDVVVTGNYVDQGDTVTLKPMTVVRTSQKVVAKTLNFNKQDYMCSDPANTSKKALCKNAYENIAKAVKELLEAL